MFTQASVCTLPPPPGRQPTADTPLGRHPLGRHPLGRHVHLGRRPLQQTVCIPLECILVSSVIWEFTRKTDNITRNVLDEQTNKPHGSCREKVSGSRGISAMLTPTKLVFQRQIQDLPEGSASQLFGHVTYGWIAGSWHPTGMLSCNVLKWKGARTHNSTSTKFMQHHRCTTCADINAS